MIDQEVLIEILRQVPEKRLKIFELAWELVGEDGNLDPDKVIFYSEELEQAVSEAKAYSAETAEAVQCLKSFFKL